LEVVDGSLGPEAPGPESLPGDGGGPVHRGDILIVGFDGRALLDRP